MLQLFRGICSDWRLDLQCICANGAMQDSVIGEESRLKREWDTCKPQEALDLKQYGCYGCCGDSITRWICNSAQC